MYGFIYNNTNKYFYIRDVTGLILGISSQAGTNVVKYSYDAWGKIKSITDTSGILIGTKNPFRYKGYYYDVETNLFLVSSRYYSPELCRWISPDDIEYLNPESVNGLNLYCYCFNNPIMYKDSSGHYPEGVVPSDNIFGWRNKDGSWSLYDNDRFEDYTPFHEQLFAINWSGFKLKDNMFGGTVSFTLITGGWEWKHLDLSLLDFGHAELGFEIGANGVSASAFASIYSPSVSFDLFGITIEISFEVGAAGFDFKYNKEEKYFKSKFAGGFGAGITFDW